MSVVILEQSVVEQLRAIQVGVEVRDRHGNLIGFFLPAIVRDEVDQFECPVDEEELIRRAHQGGGRRLQEILDDLRKSS